MPSKSLDHPEALFPLRSKENTCWYQLWGWWRRFNEAFGEGADTQGVLVLKVTPVLKNA